MPQTATPHEAPPGCKTWPSMADGFLIDPAQWNEQVAQAIAAVDGVGPLTPDHWGIIHYMREHHFTYGSLPPRPRSAIAKAWTSTPCKRLFGGCRSAWRLAGLPNPGDEALSYMN